MAEQTAMTKPTLAAELSRVAAVVEAALSELLPEPESGPEGVLFEAMR